MTAMRERDYELCSPRRSPVTSWARRPMARTSSPRWPATARMPWCLICACRCWNGMQATRIIKERWPAITVVALTMYVAHRDAALAAGADAVVSKGDTPTQVIQVLRVLAHRAAVQTPPEEPGPR